MRKPNTSLGLPKIERSDLDLVESPLLSDIELLKMRHENPELYDRINVLAEKLFPQDIDMKEQFTGRLGGLLKGIGNATLREDLVESFETLPPATAA